MDVSAAWLAYQRMRTQLNGTITRELSRHTGLSEADYDILLFLTEQTGNEADGSVRSVAVRCGLEWEKSRLSHQLRRMEERGLITKAPGALIRVTDRGREQIAAARECHDAAVRRYFGDLLSPEELAMLTAVAERVVSRLTGERHHGAD